MGSIVPTNVKKSTQFFLRNVTDKVGLLHYCGDRAANLLVIGDW
jgi:hypothetical protein